MHLCVNEVSNGCLATSEGIPERKFRLTSGLL